MDNNRMCRSYCNNHAAYRVVMTVASFLAGGVALANSVTVDPTTGETLYVFDTVGAFSWTAPANQNVELLVVGGGGGGGCGNYGGGGGGGQVYHSSAFAVTQGSVYSGTVGAGDLDGRTRILDRCGRTAQENPAALPDIGCYECAEKAQGFDIFIR